MCTTPNTDETKKRKMDKHAKGGTGYKMISTQLDVPVNTVANVMLCYVRFRRKYPWIDQKDSLKDEKRTKETF